MQRQIKTHYWRSANHCHRDLSELGLAAESHHQRPNQIELFLDGERPGDAQWPSGSGWIPNHKILKEKREGPPRGGPVKHCVGFGWTQERNNHKHEKQYRIVQGPDPQKASRVKIPEIAL